MAGAWGSSPLLAERMAGIAGAVRHCSGAGGMVGVGDGVGVGRGVAVWLGLGVGVGVLLGTRGETEAGVLSGRG